MLVIAFDGVIFDSIGARALAAYEALRAEGYAVTEAIVQPFVGGRSLPEIVRAAAHCVMRETDADKLDETKLDIASIRADQTFASVAMRGFSLHPQARDMLQHAASVTRIVIRADSRRREVEALIEMAGLDALAHMTRCSDDPGSRSHTTVANVDRAVPVASSLEFHAYSIRRSYEHIKHRLSQHVGMLGERGPVGIAVEASLLATGMAVEFGFDAASSLSALKFPNL